MELLHAFKDELSTVQARLRQEREQHPHSFEQQGSIGTAEGQMLVAMANYLNAQIKRLEGQQ